MRYLLATVLFLATPAAAQWALVQTGAATPTASNPGTRQGHRMSYSRWHGYTVMHGDSSKSTSDGTYTFDGVNDTWTRRSTGATIVPRDNPAMAYHDIGKTVLLFGGHDGTNYKNDVWRWDDTNKKFVAVTATGTKPSAREGATWANQRLTNNMFLFGGYDGTNLLNDTWKFAYNPISLTGVWTNISHATQRPAACRDATMLYDFNFSRLVLSSGLTATGRQTKTEYINGNPTAVNTWTNLFTSSDVGRQGPGVWVAHNAKILFGQGFLSTTGTINAGTQSNRVFGMKFLNQWTSNSWIAEPGSSTSAPEPAYQGGMASIDKENKLLIYGGLVNTGVGTSAIKGNTYIFNYEAWSQQTPLSNGSCGQNGITLSHVNTQQPLINQNLTIDALASNYGATRVGVWILADGYAPLYYPTTTSCYTIPDLGATTVILTAMSFPNPHSFKSIFIPNLSTLVGRDYYSQVTTADTTANTPGITFSEGIRLTLGRF